MRTAKALDSMQIPNLVSSHKNNSSLSELLEVDISEAVPVMDDVAFVVQKVAPKLAEISENVIYADIWERPDLSKRDRSLITIAALVGMNRTGSIGPHIRMGLANGLSATEIGEILTHMAFYAGWPASVAACQIAQEVLDVWPMSSENPVALA
jgi:4-carboxymuconolactone decarboxylase